MRSFKVMDCSDGAAARLPDSLPTSNGFRLDQSWKITVVNYPQFQSSWLCKCAFQKCVIFRALSSYQPTIPSRWYQKRVCASILG